MNDGLERFLIRRQDMTFDEWHHKQLNGDADNCPHEDGRNESNVLKHCRGNQVL